MKKFYSFLFAAVALVGFAACNSDSTEEPAPAQKVGKVEFTANIDDSRTNLGTDFSVTWEGNETIAIKSGEKVYEFILKDGSLSEDKKSATFVYEGGDFKASENMSAVHPYNAEGTPKIATNQNGTFGGAMVMSGVATKDGVVTFNTHNTVILTFTVPAACKEVKINDKVVKADFAAGTTYYASVEDGTNNLEVRIDGYLSKKAATKAALEKGNVYKLGVLPAPVESGWELMGLNNWANSAKMYKDLDWFVAYNITSSSNEFKFKNGGTWVGAKSDFLHKDVYAYPEGGTNIKAEKSNTAYDFYYNPEGGLYMILPAGTDINQDIYVATDMFIRGNYTNYSGYGNWGKGRTPIVAQGKYYLFKEYTFSSNPEFKFTTSEEGWDWQYSTENTLTENTWTTLKNASSLGGNTKFSKAGTYDIYTTSDKNNRNKVLIVTHGNAPAAMN